MIEVREVKDVRDEKLREDANSKLADLEAQAFFTAVMTDTYIEDEEGDPDEGIGD